MNKHLKIAVLIVIVLVHSIGSIYSQTEQYKFRHITTKMGLPSNNVSAIVKGSEGFMWFATDNGLARYDGYNIKTYHLPFDSIATGNSQEINCLFEDNV